MGNSFNDFPRIIVNSGTRSISLCTEARVGTAARSRTAVLSSEANARWVSRSKEVTDDSIVACLGKWVTPLVALVELTLIQNHGVFILIGYGVMAYGIGLIS